jgi:hypothetical protein
MALNYLRDWGESFWQETEYRVKEITTKLEKELQGKLEGKLSNFGSLGTSAARKLTEEQKEEIVHRAQEVVNNVQIRELSTVIELLDEVLVNDPQQHYFITIDKLDEDWIEESLRLRLIRALIETSLDFARVRNVKIIVAIRFDLLDRVYRYTRDSGFQEEKFRTSSLDITWSKPQLIDVLNTRIQQLVKEQYTKKAVTYNDLLPTKMGKQPIINYIMDRTLKRPRDIINFFNLCIRFSDGKPKITLKALREAEGAYSRERLRALADEWYGVYPNLFHLVQILKGSSSVFYVKEINIAAVEENYLNLLVSGRGAKGQDLELMNLVFDGGIELEEYTKSVIMIFYKVGIVGLKTDPQISASRSDFGTISISRAELTNDTKVLVHKAYWRVLGIGN